MRVVVFAARIHAHHALERGKQRHALGVDAALGGSQVAGETLGDRGGKASVDENRCGLQRISAVTAKSLGQKLSVMPALNERPSPGTGAILPMAPAAL